MPLEFTPVSASRSIVTTGSTTPVVERIKGIDSAFEEFLNFDIANGAASGDTIATYKSQVKLFLQWCIDVELNPLLAQTQHIKLYRKYLINKAYKTATINLKLGVVRRFYDALIDHQFVSSNPAKSVKAPVNRRSKVTKHISKEQFQMLLSLTEGDDPKLKRDRVIIGLMGLHGLRTIEVMRLSFGDIFQRDGRHIVNVASKRAEREVILRKDFYVWLVSHLVGKKLVKRLPIISSLSGNNYGNRISRSGIRNITNSYLALVGARRIDINLSNHALRHHYATQLYAATEDIALVQESMGHSDPRTTSKYVALVNRVAAADFIEI